MRIKHYWRSAVQRTVLLSFVAVTLLGVAGAAFVPVLSQRAAAAGSSINLPERGKKINTRENRDIAFGTCEPYWDKALKSRSLLQSQFYPKMDDLPYQAKDSLDAELEWLRDAYDERTIVSRIGDDFGDQQLFDDNHDKIERAALMLVQMGKQEIPVIRFRAAASGSVPLDGVYSQNSSVCGNYMMIPVGYKGGTDAESWRGFEILNSEYGANNPDRARGEYMKFKLSGGSKNKGSFDYWGKTNGGELVQKFSERELTIDGTYPNGGNNNNPNVGTINATWVDAATIKINNSRQDFAGEVYKKRSWNTRQVGGTYYSYYFLDTASPGRENLTWNSNNKKCEDALPLSNACGGNGICVPFIAIKQRLNVSTDDNGLNRLQSNINQLGGGQAELYDFNESCVPNSRYTIALSERDNAKIWLYYSSSQKAFMPVFSTGDGNEVKYIGTYGETKAPTSPQTGGEYKLGECVAVITGNPIQTSAATTFSVSWKLTDGNCGSPRTYGTLGVLALGGTAGEAGFTAAQQEAQNTLDAGASEAKFVCNLTTGALNWILCPITRLILEGIDAMEAVINSVLTLNVDRIFNSKFFDTWSGFRTLALALIAIAALVMVVSQAAGVEILDAYTIKKVLPRLLFAAIAITVSWSLMQFFVTLSNDLGTGIRYVIYSPFPKETNLGGLGFTGLLVGILSGGAFLAFGVLGMLTFAGTALLAAAVAFGIIVFRELLVMFLVISAPFAIACYILPNTQKIWEMWKNAFIAALMVFVIITTFIALGRVFAIVALQSGGSETLNQIIAFVAYILPYFLITTAFRMAGGVMSTVGGLVNDRTKGGFDRLRNARSNIREDRARRWKEGRLYDSDNMLFQPGAKGLRRPFGALASASNKIGGRKGLGWKRGAYGFGERGRQAAALRTFIDAEEERKKNPWIDALANTDDAGMLVLAASGGNAARARQFANQRVANGTWNSGQAEEAYKSAMAVGINRGTAIASLQKLAENKSREVAPGDIATIRQAIADVSGGNTALADKLSYDFQFRARGAGRTDIGGVWHTPEKLAEARQMAVAMESIGGATNYEGRQYASPSAAGISAQEATARRQALLDEASGTVAYFDGADRSTVTQAIAGHPNEIKALNQSAKNAFRYGDAAMKEKAALMLHEAQKGLAPGQASATNRDAINKMLAEHGLDAESLSRAGTTMEEVLAAKIGSDPLPAYDVNGRQLVDASGRAIHNPYTAAMVSARARAFDSQAQRANMMSGDQ